MSVSLNPFFDSSLDLLCVANFDGYFVDVNPAFLRMIGYTKQELLSKKINDFVYAGDRQQTEEIRKGLFDSQSITSFENRYRTKSGDLAWLSWSAVPIENKKLVYAIAKNITHQKVLKNERLDELVKLIQQNEDLTRFNLITSHDLRSPMHSVLSLFNLINYDEIKNKETLEILKYIEIGVKGVKNSLDNYLNIMRNSSFGKAALEEVVLDDSLSAVINSIGSLIQNSNTTISSDFSSFQSVYFNKVFMQSIFLNLITNAIKYTKPGVYPALELFSSIEDGQKTLVVRDNGSGMDLTVIGDKLFNLNQRFDSEKEGKGVGLYIVHNQITSLGGEISVKSELNQGTTFTIKFKTD
ncbi:sensor histidine kinase [Maribacter antarcticus]|uniref:sensor histidine kinase n=1 Tax=Maribacter antarcticus TaxID=505250 RepID=UPI00047B8BBC|nr:PAS domain-containing sensor histidine kinase [Maribacter antarcticus]